MKEIYAVAYQRPGARKKQKEFNSRMEAEVLVKRLKRQGVPYTFARHYKLSLLQRLKEVRLSWFGYETNVPTFLAVLAASTAFVAGLLVLEKVMQRIP